MARELHLLSPKGFRAGAAHAGIRTARRSPDVALLVCEALAPAAAVFTANRVVAAPVKVAREHIAGGKLRGVVVNAGNANACTGLHGELDARHMCATAAQAIGCDPRHVLPCSTGVIGQMLPMANVEKGIRAAARALGSSPRHANQFADAILTTDTRRKTAAAQFTLGGGRGRGATIRIAGVCKGSGMIAPVLTVNSDALAALGIKHADDFEPPAIAPPRPRTATEAKGDARAGLSQALRARPASRRSPRHATMLAFITTDARISPPRLRELLAGAADASFNAVTVDQHTSTNDTAVLIASGAGGATISSQSDLRSFADALRDVCQSLAWQIAADGEGATKVITVTVSHAPDEPVARTIARTIANSPLVKCAIHGNDPNWGRIVSAAGYAGVPFDPDRATLALQGKIIFRHGQPVAFDENQISRLLHNREVHIHLSCGHGRATSTCWTCDLSEEYVKINADYHT